MASILDRYGIKEVADVTFYKINEDGSQGNPVLFLDTLKVSTIEQTAETADARGGKGNPKLITWDYGKEITVTIEDALFSPKSMGLMWGGKDANIAAWSTVDKSINYRAVDSGAASALGVKRDGNKFVVSSDSAAISVAWYDAQGALVSSNFVKGERYIGKFSVPVNGNKIVVSADTFPGTYYVTGDTYARSDVTGDDQFFQFVIPKAKVTSENTITLEAEGDPSTFSMNLTVLRPEDGEMMKLIQYDLPNG